MSKLLFQVSDNPINKSDYVNIEEAKKRFTNDQNTDIYNWDRLDGIYELLLKDGIYTGIDEKGYPYFTVDKSYYFNEREADFDKQLVKLHDIHTQSPLSFSGGTNELQDELEYLNRLYEDKQSIWIYFNKSCATLDRFVRDYVTSYDERYYVGNVFMYDCYTTI